jgi:Trk K+ transport system NAD-binding subunit
VTTLVVGPDEDGLGAALSAAGEEVSRVEGVPDGDALRRAGADDADLFVLTDVGEATTIAVVKERNPDVRVVVYDDGSLPAFASGQADLAVDPALLGPETVAEELTNGAAGG